MGHALSAVLLLITVGSLLLQLRTVRRVGTAGLAPATWFGLVASTLVWLGYGVAMREPTVVVINLLVLAVGVALTVAILRSLPIAPSTLAPYVVGPVLVWCGAWAAGAPWLLGVAGTALVIGRLVPQLVRALQATDRSGVSRGAWVGNGVTNIAWAAYGFTTGDPFVSWPSVASACLSFTIVALVVGRRQDATAPSAAVTADTTNTSVNAPLTSAMNPPSCGALTCATPNANVATAYRGP